MGSPRSASRAAPAPPPRHVPLRSRFRGTCRFHGTFRNVPQKRDRSGVAPEHHGDGRAKSRRRGPKNGGEGRKTLARAAPQRVGGEMEGDEGLDRVVVKDVRDEGRGGGRAVRAQREMTAEGEGRGPRLGEALLVRPRRGTRSALFCSLLPGSSAERIDRLPIRFSVGSVAAYPCESAFNCR